MKKREKKRRKRRHGKKLTKKGVTGKEKYFGGESRKEKRVRGKGMWKQKWTKGMQ